LNAPIFDLSSGKRSTNARSLLQQLHAAGHAEARVEHHDDGDRLNPVLEEDQHLQLLVVEDLEVRLREVRYEAALRIEDRDEERHDPRSGAEEGSLAETHRVGHHAGQCDEPEYEDREDDGAT
jgi:hypothetical protein